MGKMNLGLPLIGKYRDIVIAASLFIVFDMTVLVLNFYTSFEIAEDATSINLAGRQRMLSQRMTKALLQIETARTAEQKVIAIDELNKTSILFGNTFNAFKSGGNTKNTDGTDITLAAVNDATAQLTLKQAEQIWNPLQNNIMQLIQNPGNEAALLAALSIANANNLNLLKQMNDLTTRLAVLAQDKAQRLRMFQTIGITLALINFALLLFHFLRKLNRSDAATEEARQETEEILTTVSDGFFLVDEDLNLGHKSSSAMSRLFRREITPGTPFLTLLEGKVNQQTLDTAKEYIKLLFTRRIKENLTADLNPLVKLEIDLSEDAQKQDIHYLNISFKRVKNDEKISHLLGSVSDITEQVRLEKSLEISEARSQEELKLLSQILQSNPIMMRDYVESLRKFLLSVNDMLEKSSMNSDYSHIIDQSLPALHKLKGDASAMGSDVFAGMAHDLEQSMKQLQYNRQIKSEDLLAITVQINSMLAKLGSVAQIIEKLMSLIPVFGDVLDNDRLHLWKRDLNTLAGKVSEDLGKHVVLDFSQSNLNQIETVHAEKLRDICVQMIRNAIAHGIELPVERLMLQKPEAGKVSISLMADSEKTEMIIRDDGEGLSVDKIKKSLIDKREFTQEQLDEMDDKTIIMSIFRSGISTADELTEHAGQGLGLSVVKQAVNDLGGRLMIASRRGEYTEFKFVFSNVELVQLKEVMAA